MLLSEACRVAGLSIEYVVVTMLGTDVGARSGDVRENELIPLRVSVIFGVKELDKGRGQNVWVFVLSALIEVPTVCILSGMGFKLYPS